MAGSGRRPGGRSGAVLMLDTQGRSVEELRDSTADELGAQLNEAAARTRIAPIVWIGFVVLLFVAPVVWVVLAVPLILAAIWLQLRDRARRSVVVFYEVSGEASAWFEAVAAADEVVAGAAKLWRQQASGALVTTHQRKANGGASSLTKREGLQHSIDGPSVLKTNVRVPTFVCGNASLTFLPDRVLVADKAHHATFAYSDVSIVFTTTRFIEDGTVPRDARQVGTTWRYTNVNGGPDRRYKGNGQLPIMEYGVLAVTSHTGLKWIIQISRSDAAGAFADVLRRRPIHPSPPVSTPVPLAPRQVTPPRHLAPLEPQLPPAPPAAPPQPTMPRTPAAQVRSRERRHATVPLAAPQQAGQLFCYASSQGEYAVPERFALIDLETTGFSPDTGDRAIEIAIAVCGPDGRIMDEYATLLNPDGRDTGPVHVHGVTNDAVADAPRFRDVLGEIIPRINGSVIVAHNAAFEERFLLSEFAHAGVRTALMPALCTLWLARQTMDLPNHRLATLRRIAGIPDHDAHTALGDVRGLAALLPGMLTRYAPLRISAPPVNWTFPQPMRAPITRAANLRQGQDGWMSSLLSRLPISAAEATDAQSQHYLDALTDALDDGKIIGREVKHLAHLAGKAGMGAQQVQNLNERFLELMREAAFEDDVLTSGELTAMNKAAAALGVPAYFDDLRPTGATGPALPSPSTPTTKVRRCGHCRRPGHYRPKCPDLV